MNVDEKNEDLFGSGNIEAVEFPALSEQKTITVINNIAPTNHYGGGASTSTKKAGREFDMLITTGWWSLFDNA